MPQTEPAAEPTAKPRAGSDCHTAPHSYCIFVKQNEMAISGESHQELSAQAEVANQIFL